MLFQKLRRHAVTALLGLLCGLALAVSAKAVVMALTL